MPPLTVRNQTGHVVTIARVESVGLTGTSALSKLGLKNPFSRSDERRHDSAHHHAVSASSSDRSVAPFSDCECECERGSEFDPQRLSATETYALTLSIQSTTQTLTLPTTSPSSKFASRALLTLPEVSIFYVPSSATLTVYTHPPLHQWMSKISDATSLSALSIPGTHNSATYHRALPSVRCQAVSPAGQLQNGVRFFDVRVQCPSSIANTASDTGPGVTGDHSHDFQLVHGLFPVSMTGPKYLRPLLATIRTFLTRNPSETVILSLKREGRNTAGDQDLSGYLAEAFAEKDWWYTSPEIPTLGQCRGKMVLMRRFLNAESVKVRYGYGERGNWGLDANGWTYNCRDAIVDRVCVQDVCELPRRQALDLKAGYAIEHLRRARDQCAGGEGGPDAIRERLYLNFLSASNLFRRGCWPEDVAARLNPEIEDWLFANRVPGAHLQIPDTSRDRHAPPAPAPVSGFGVLICDWVGRNGNWDLVRTIVGSNAALFS